MRSGLALVLLLAAPSLQSDEQRAVRRHQRRRRHAIADVEGRSALLQPRRSAWQPRHVRPCNSTGYLERPRVSALVQTFREGANAAQLASRLHALPSVEVLVNDDSRRDHAVWLEHLHGANDAVVSSANVHEIRAYNRLARMARGEFLLLLQGDHCLPALGTAWLDEAFELFEAFPSLGMLGGQMGFNQVPLKRIAESISWGVPPCKTIPTQLPANHTKPAGARARGGLPFMFVAGVNIGPLLVRREAFLRCGGFDEAFSCAGEPGIQLDTELSLQMWRRGYQVGLWYSGVTNGVGGRKTRSNKVQKRARAANDHINGQRCERLMHEHDTSAVRAANAQLSKLAQPEEARAATFQRLGLEEARRCRAIQL